MRDASGDERAGDGVLPDRTDVESPLASARGTGSSDGAPAGPPVDAPLSESDRRLLEQLGRHSEPVVQAVEDQPYASADGGGAARPSGTGAPDPLDPTFLAPPT